MKPFLPLSAVNDSGTTTITIINEHIFTKKKCHESFIMTHDINKMSVLPVNEVL